MRKIFIFLLLLLLFNSGAFAGIYIYEPQDQLITLKEVVMLRGVGKDLDTLKVNNRAMSFKPNGSFTCGLVLRPGKNYVEIRALDKNKGHFVKTIRILALKTYPDIEVLYEGKKHWAREQIVNLSSLGFIEGYPDNNYYPGFPVTRGELATWLARVKELKIRTLTEDVFFDVPKERWRAPYIKATVDAGYMTGYNNQTFGIDDPISRREAAEIAVITEGLGVVEKVRPLFVDVPKEEKGALPIYVAGRKGLIKGVSKDIPVFDPDRALTRAETAVLLSRFRNVILSSRYLFDFNQGYSSAVFCRLNIAPEIVSFQAEPRTIRSKEKTTVELRVKIAEREGFFPISKIKVDLSELGGMPDVEMFDDGTHGDEEKEDLIYSLNISLEPEKTGEKTLSVTAVDRLGWESEKKASLLVLE